MTPWDAIGKVFLGIYQEKKLQSWITLIFQMTLSAITTFLFLCGTSLIASKSFEIGIGSGMVGAAIVITVFFRRSNLTKGMLMVLPTDEAKDELETNLQSIQR